MNVAFASSVIVVLVVVVTIVSGNHGKTYDYVIVGAGASGCVLANRLSANGTYSVLLLEAGGTPNELSEVPAFSQYMGFSGNLKAYLMERQNNFGLSAIGQRVFGVTGEALGGSTVADDLIYSRSTASDYDRWASLGNPGWSYEEVLPYFRKFEDTRIPDPDTTQRGVGGPVGVSETPYKTPAVHVFIEAVKESRLNYSADYNDGRPFGVGYLQSTTRNGRRSSAYTAYLRPVLNRRNLHVSPRSLVTRILFRRGGDDTAVRGVAYERGNAIHEAYAEREVIVSAGAIGSPKLLMLSGIGPQDHLAELGIPTRVDLPVGKVLEDHVAYPALAFTVNDSIVPTYDQMLSPRNHVAWVLRGTGPLTIPSFSYEANGYLKTKVSDPSDVSPDLALVFSSASFATDHGLNSRHGWNFDLETYDRIFAPLQEKYTFTVLPILIHPASKGHLRLTSDDPHADPVMLGNYLSDADNTDVRTLVAGIRMIQKMVRDSPVMRRYDATGVLTPAPGCEGPASDSDEMWECQLRHLATGDFHRVATCAMGSVVQSDLRVPGVRGLRVADASVIPFSLSGQSTATAYMIGEKAADLILAESE